MGPDDGGRRSATAMRASSATSLVALGTTVVVVALLYFGEAFLVPFALALLLSFMLAPLVDRLRRWHLPKIVAVLVVVAVAVVVIAGISLVISRQVVSLAGSIPLYQQNIEAKIRSLREVVPGGGVLERTSQAVKDIQKDIEDATNAKPPPVAERPLSVRIEPDQPSPITVVTGLLGPVLGPLGTAGIVIVLAIFMLLGKEDLRDRLIRIMGTNDLHRTTQALDEAGRRVSRYLLMQLVVNGTYGIAIGAGLWLIGVPNPILWGVLATVLRFIPYLGPILTAAFPLALSVAVAPDWAPLAWTAGLFIGVELIIANVVEPWLYGASTGISPSAIIFAAVFWTWVWGVVGLLLSTPLTVCLVVLGRHLPQMHLFEVLFGTEPVLTAGERFYQRLLADNVDEALEIAEEYLDDKPLVDLFDDVVLPALRLADYDRRRGVLDEDGIRAIAAGFTTVVDAVVQDSIEDAPPPPIRSGGRPPPLVLCIAARTEFDAVTAAMLLALLATVGRPGRVLASRRRPPAGSEAQEPVDDGPPAAACLCMMQTTTAQQARRSWHRLARHRLPRVPVVLGLWDLAPATAGEQVEDGTLPVATSFREALSHLIPLTDPAAADSEQAWITTSSS